MKYQKEVTLLMIGGALSIATYVAKEFLIDRPKERSAFRVTLSRDLYERGSAEVQKTINAYNALLGALGEKEGLSRDEFAPLSRQFETAYFDMQRYCEEVRRLGSVGQFRVVDGFRQIMIDEWRYVWIHNKSLALLRGSALMLREASSADDNARKIVMDVWQNRVDRVIKSESYLYFRARDVSLPLFENYRSTFEAAFRSELGLDTPADFAERQNRVSELLVARSNFVEPSPTHPYTAGKMRAFMAANVRTSGTQVDEAEESTKRSVAMALLAKTLSEEEPNQSPEPTTMAVTPPAAQEPRQP